MDINERLAMSLHAMNSKGVADTLAMLSQRGVKVVFPMLPKSAICHVIFNDPATVVFWNDGTKTVVKCSENDTFDPEIGLAMAICKKTFGNTGAYNEVFRKWVNPE